MKYIYLVLLFIVFSGCKSFLSKDNREVYLTRKTYDEYLLDLLNADSIAFNKNDSTIIFVYDDYIDYFYNDSTLIKGHFSIINGKKVKDGNWYFYKKGKLCKTVVYNGGEISSIILHERRKSKVVVIHDPSF